MERLKRLIRLTATLVLGSFLLLSTSTSVYAISNPDSGPFIVQVDAYQNLDTIGDVLLLVRINIPYAVAPDEPSSKAFIGRLLLAGETVAETIPYAFYNSGYGYNTFALYASSGITWEAAYTINLSGSPTLEWTGDIPNISTTTIDWHTSSSSALSQSLLASNILDWASSLTSYWSVVLLTTTAGGSVLSSYGVAYFTNVIPYLQTLCPAVLPTRQLAVTYDDQDFQNAEAAAVVNQWPFDFSGIAIWMGLPDANLLHIILAASMIAFLCITLKLDSKMSLVASFALILLLAIPGFLDPMVAAATIFVAVLGLGLVFILGKPTT